MSLRQIKFMSVCVVLTLPLMGGCGVGELLDTKFPVPTTYVLAPAAAGASNTPKIGDLAIGIPSPAPGLDTERIATLHDARRLDYYQDVRWGAIAPYVMQTQIVASLENQQLFRSVTPEQARISATHLLDLQLRDFQAEYVNGAAPSVRVTVSASLIRLKDRKLLKSFPVTFSVQAEENRMGAVVAAFESASQQVALAVGQQAAATMTGEAN
jgi:cholesterol transport system auxiliary component